MRAVCPHLRLSSLSSFLVDSSNVSKNLLLCCDDIFGTEVIV
jgi:hypothetical protein